MATILAMDGPRVKIQMQVVLTLFRDIGQFKLLRYDVSVRRQGQTIYNVLNIIYPVLCCFINDTFMFITFAL